MQNPITKGTMNMLCNAHNKKTRWQSAAYCKQTPACHNKYLQSPDGNVQRAKRFRCDKQASAKPR